MSRPVVSVVIPCYNHGHYLGAAIESALSQVYEPTEVIVVNDGSTDDTTEIAAGYDGVRVVCQPNLGLAAARNRGISVSKGDFLVFLDADDVLLSGALEAGLECFERHPESAFVYGRYRLRGRNGEVVESVTSGHEQRDPYIALLKGNFISMHATVMYRRSTLEEIGEFDPDLEACEDYDLYLRATRKLPIAGHEKLVAEYRKRSDSMSGDAPRMLSAVLEVMDRQKEFVEKDRERLTAYLQGIRFWKAFYGIRSLRQIAYQLVRRDVDGAGEKSSALLSCVGFWEILINSPVWLWRHWLAGKGSRWGS